MTGATFNALAPFGHLSLCMSCDYASDTPGDVCPHCGYRGLLNLKKAFESITHFHVYDSANGVVRDADGTYLCCDCGERRQTSIQEGRHQ